MKPTEYTDVYIEDGEHRIGQDGFAFGFGANKWSRSVHFFKPLTSRLKELSKTNFKDCKWDAKEKQCQKIWNEKGTTTVSSVNTEVVS